MVTYYWKNVPPSGIWGGLWGFPQCELDEKLDAWCKQSLNVKIVHQQDWPAFKHIFTHFELTIHPKFLTVEHDAALVMETPDQFWYKISEPLPGGIAAPVAKLFKLLKGEL